MAAPTMVQAMRLPAASSADLVNLDIVSLPNRYYWPAAMVDAANNAATAILLRIAFPFDSVGAPERVSG
jgi:hypothetical protein